MTDRPVSRDTAHLIHVIRHHGITLMLDVGAHLGEYAGRLRAGGYGGRIVSFEPQSAAHERLSRAAAGDAKWTVAPRVALGDSDQPLTINLSAESDMSSVLRLTDEMERLLDGSAYIGTEVVSQARLDALFPKHAAPDDRVMLKIDAQGYERRVLDGARNALKRIQVLQMELSIVPVYRNETPWRSMIDYLENGFGFTPVLFIPGYFNRRTARLIGMDGVFVRT